MYVCVCVCQSWAVSFLVIVLDDPASLFIPFERKILGIMYDIYLTGKSGKSQINLVERKVRN